MNRKTALFLLGTACLFALINQSSAGKSKSASDVQNGDAEDGGTERRGHHGPGGPDFRKRVEEVFNKEGVNNKTRDEILNGIKEIMEEFHKTKGGMRKRRRQEQANTEDQTKPSKV